MEIISIKNKKIKTRIKPAPEENAIKVKSIAKFWQRQQNLNDYLFNGDAFLSENGIYQVKSDEIIFDVYQTEYMNYYYNVKMENSSRSIKASILIVTNDDYIVLGEYDTPQNKKMLNFIGGAYDVADIDNDITEINTNRAIERLLFEQLPLRYNDVERIEPLLLIEESTGEVVLVYETHLKTSKDLILKEYETMKMKEFDNLYFLALDQKDLIDFAFSEVECAFYVKPAVEYFYKSLITKE